MEKRRYVRHLLPNETSFVAKLLLSGGSLLETTTPRTIEIGAHPLNISQGGIGLTLVLEVPWETLTPQKQVTLLLSVGEQIWLLPATVTRHEKDHRTIGLEFKDPLKTLAPFLAPAELQ